MVEPSVPGGLIGSASARSVPMRPSPRVNISITAIVVSLRFQLSNRRPENSAITANTAPAIASAARVSISENPARPLPRRLAKRALLRRLADFIAVKAVTPAARAYKNENEVIEHFWNLVVGILLRRLTQ